MVTVLFRGTLIQGLYDALSFLLHVSDAVGIQILIVL